jgi:hypothetical protein
MVGGPAQIVLQAAAGSWIQIRNADHSGYSPAL